MQPPGLEGGSPESPEPGWPEDGWGSGRSPGALLLHLARPEEGRCPRLAPTWWVIPWHLLLAEQRLQDIGVGEAPDPPC